MIDRIAKIKEPKRKPRNSKKRDPDALSASEYVKSHGVKSLALLADLCGKKPDGQPATCYQTLDRMYKHKFDMFNLIVLGAKVKLKEIINQTEDE